MQKRRPIPMKLITLGVTLFAVLGSLYVGWKLTARSAYEAASYRVVRSDGQFEVREYPELKMASTGMRSRTGADDGSFMRLFGYISGKNQEQQSVAMTIPVFMDDANDGASGRMGFVLPQSVAESSIPHPSDDNVAIVTRHAGRFATIQFNGQMDAGSVAEAETKLRRWIDEQGLTGDERAEYAGYDPPWTPGLLRRNEVLIRLIGEVSDSNQ